MNISLKKIKNNILAIITALLCIAVTFACREALGASIVGDINNSGSVTSDDAIYLLMHTQFAEDYPIASSVRVDFNDDGKVTSDDAIYLLMYTQFPEDYPLEKETEPQVPYSRVKIAYGLDSSVTNYRATVKEMQKALIELGYQGARGITIKTDGVYTYDLLQSIAYYQIVNDIKDPDGVASPKGSTWTLIDKQLAAKKAGTYKQPAAYVMMDLNSKTVKTDKNVIRTVKEIQFMLNALGYKYNDGTTITQDGNYSSKLINVISNYQVINLISDPDGSATVSGTLTLIRSQYKEKVLGTYKGYTAYTRVSLEPGMSTSDINAKRTVNVLAWKLKLLGYKTVDGNDLAQDGVYSAAKIAAVKEFQLLNGITPDGVVGSPGYTWTAIEKAYSEYKAGTYKKPTYTTMSIDSKSSSTDENVKKTVLDVQYRLTELGYSGAFGYKIDLDGVYDYELFRTLMYYQIVNGISSPNGTVTASGTTITKIHEQYKQKVLGTFSGYTAYSRYSLTAGCAQTSVNAKRTLAELIWSLNTLGYTYVDGTKIPEGAAYDSKLAAAVKEFQRLSGDSNPDGVCGASGLTWKFIDQQIKEYFEGTYQKRSDVVDIDNSKYSAGAVSNCGKDENGGSSGGAAGDQTGQEFWVINWYDFGQNYVLRYTGTRAEEVRALIAQYAIAAANNNHIGYDQSQRTTFWTELAKVGYNPAKITVNCEADCSSSVATIVKAVGYTLNIQALKDVDIGLYTGNEKSVLEKAGFTATNSAYYTDQSAYLLVGDINLNTSTHTNICIKDGSKASDQSHFGAVAPVVEGLQRGDSGSEVSTLQTNLNKLGYKGSDGKALTVDGSFGANTEYALKSFQKDNGLTQNGVYDASTKAKMTEKLKSVTTEEPTTNSWKVIVNTDSNPLNVRTGAGQSYSIKTSLAKGTTHTATKTAKDSNGDEWTYLSDVGGWAISKYLKKV